ncbi:hypothetical protein SmphiM6_110 [Sinorhizobium phage phiM6]|nr:hypothetical protein SmphiM6_110 [Sinorhizobium phage phiM6]
MRRHVEVSDKAIDELLYALVDCLGVISDSLYVQNNIWAREKRSKLKEILRDIINDTPFETTPSCEEDC